MSSFFLVSAAPLGIPVIANDDTFAIGRRLVPARSPATTLPKKRSP